MNSIIYYFLILTLLFSCRDMTNYNTYTHENGLNIKVPDTYTNVRKTDNGFSIGKLEDDFIRNPRIISINVLSNDSIIKNYEWEQLDDDVFFRTESHEGFSGGTMFIFQAWKKSNSKFIFLEESFQDEFINSPEFKIGKKIILESNITLPGKNNQ